MLSIRTNRDLDRALDAPLEPYLRRLLMLRRDQLVGDTGLDLGEFMHAIVVRVGDTLAQIEAEAGVPISTNLVDGKRLEDTEFEPSFDYVRRSEGWLEAVMITTDDGFALVLLVPDLITVDPSITLLLRRCVAA